MAGKYGDGYVLWVYLQNRPYHRECQQPPGQPATRRRQARRALTRSGVLGLLADDWVFHDGVAEVIHHRRDGEDAAQPLIQTFSGVVCLACAYALSAPDKAIGEALSASPATTLRLVIKSKCPVPLLISPVMAAG